MDSLSIIHFAKTISNTLICNVFKTSDFVLLKQDDLDVPGQLAVSVLVFWAFAIIFAFCEMGAQATHQFHALNEELCQVKWYLLPIEVQRMMLIFMSDAQQPMFLRGYGNILCTRDAFKNVRISIGQKMKI